MNDNDNNHDNNNNNNSDTNNKFEYNNKQQKTQVMKTGLIVCGCKRLMDEDTRMTVKVTTTITRTTSAITTTTTTRCVKQASASSG